MKPWWEYVALSGALAVSVLLVLHGWVPLPRVFGDRAQKLFGHAALVFIVGGLYSFYALLIGGLVWWIVRAAL